MVPFISDASLPLLPRYWGVLPRRAISVPCTRGSDGRQGARAVNAKRGDLGDLGSVLVGSGLGVALQAGDQPHLHRLQRCQSTPATIAASRSFVLASLPGASP